MDEHEVVHMEATMSAENQAFGRPPVWVRVPVAVRITGVGRSRLYELIRDQKIRSKVLKQRRDSQRGIRLIRYDSLLEFINGEAE
jgi:hypothetical protein